MASLLIPEKALIFRITHVRNIPWILDHGVHCPSSEVLDPDFVEIGRPDLIAKRKPREVPVAPGGTLGDYVPFYLTPLSPMLYNIKTGQGGVDRVSVEELIFLVSSVALLTAQGIPFVLADRHAFLRTARFWPGGSGLDQIDWESLRRRDFKRVPEDPERFERYQAEVLVHRLVPLSALLGLACARGTTEAKLKPELTLRGLALKLAIRPEWYFT